MTPRHLLSLFALALFSGCANTRVARTDFLRESHNLEPAPEKEVAFIPDTVEIHKPLRQGWDRYRGLLIEPISLQLQPGTHEPDEKDLDRLAKAFHRGVSGGLEDHFEFRDAPGPDTLRLRVNVIEVNPQNIWINILGIVILLPPDMGGISAEFEVTDSQTDEILFSMAARRDGSPLLILEAFTKYGHARYGMWKWSRLLRDCLRDDPPPHIPPAA